MKEWIAVLRAADMAARWHVHQRRKGIAQEPYINHLLEVASLVTQATGGADPNVVIAALLHDAVEDQGVTPEMPLPTNLASTSPISSWKLLTTSRFQRKNENVSKSRTPQRRAREAKLIKLADKTSNLRAIAASPAADWSVERRLEYVEWAKSVVAGLRGTSPWLEQQFNLAA